MDDVVAGRCRGRTPSKHRADDSVAAAVERPDLDRRSRSDSTGTPPPGVSMSEPRARQIGQFGCPSGVWFSIEIAPVAEIVPVDPCALRRAFLGLARGS